MKRERERERRSDTNTLECRGFSIIRRKNVHLLHLCGMTIWAHDKKNSEVENNILGGLNIENLNLLLNFFLGSNMRGLFAAKNIHFRSLTSFLLVCTHIHRFLLKLSMCISLPVQIKEKTHRSLYLSLTQSHIS